MSFDSFNLKYKTSKFAAKTKKFLSDLVYKPFQFLNNKKGHDYNVHKQISLDKKLVYSLSKSRIPSLRQIKYVNIFLSKKEQWILKSCLSLIVISLIFIGGRFYFKHLQPIPVEGGDYTEGLVGMPKYINPLYSGVNDVDADLSQLIYSSLFKRDNNGFLAKDLVENFEASPDGKIFTIKIKSGVTWHNDLPLTANDVVFTFNAIKDVQYKSPLRTSFSGVTIEQVDDHTVRFILKEPYAAFLELLTFGIMPQELWYQIPPGSANLADLNLRPIGSGPYKVKGMTRDKASGVIKSYDLVVNQNYYGEKASIEELIFKFYPTYEELVSALNNNSVDGISYLPNQFKSQSSDKTYLNYHKLNLPQLMGVFFNPKANSALGDKRVRQALSYSLDKKDLVSKVFNGDARVIDGPVLPDNFAYNPNTKKYNYNLEESKKLLDAAGWKPVAVSEEDIAKAETDLESKDEAVRNSAESMLNLGVGNWYAKNGKYLIVKLTTVDSGDNPKVIEEIKNSWERIGVKVVMELIPPSKIQTDVIKTRDYQALFYGEMVGADPDPYPFWHSSQIGTNGLNIANYYNKEADKLLEEARLTININDRKKNYIRFQEILAEEVPAIYLYSPVYTYVQSKKVKNYNTKSIIVPSDRLSSINEWYVKIGKKVVW